jgi:predicted negative regulator of RcsB-dependent stress response
VDAYSHEKEQIDEIKAWWSENWLFIVGGIGIAIASVWGWRAWEAHELRVAEAASSQYEEMNIQLTAGNTDRADVIHAELKQEFGSTVYAALATLKQAEMAVVTKDYTAAANELRWVMESGIDRELQLLARARLARVLLAEGDIEGALAVSEASNSGRFQSVLDEVRGDAHYLNGDREAARTAYESALANLSDDAGDPRLIQRKIDNLSMPAAALDTSSDEQVAE